MKRIVLILVWLVSLTSTFAQTATLKIGNGYCPTSEIIELPVTLEAINNPQTGNNLISSWGWYIAYDTDALYAGEPGQPVNLTNYNPQFPANNYLTNIIANNPVPGWNTIAVIYSSSVSGTGNPGDKFFDIVFSCVSGSYGSEVIWTSTAIKDDLSAKFTTNMADDEGNEFILTLIDGHVGQYFSFDVLFHVVDNTGIPLEGALVSVNPLSILTDTAGMAVLNLQCGNHNYTITKDGYRPEAGSFLVCISPVTIEDTLTLWYEVTFHATSGGDDLEGVQIDVSDESVVTDTNGIATLFLIDGSYVYTATKEGYYFEQDAFTVSGSPANVEIVMIPEPLYTVAIHVTSGGMNLDSAAVIIGNDTVFTDEGGSAVFELINGIYDFTVVKQGYIPWTGSFSVVNGPVNIEVVLVPQEYMVVFHITSGGENLSGAMVIILESGLSLITGTNGNAAFYMTNGTYHYSIIKVNYEPETGQFDVNGSNIYLEIEMSLLLYPMNFHFISQGIGLDSVTVTCNDTTIITNITGDAEFLLYCDSTYVMTATKDGYIDYYNIFTVDCYNPQTVNILMITQNLTFHCTSGGQNIQGVSVMLDGYGTQTSGNDGKAMFSIIPDGTYSYTAHKEGYIDKTGTVTLDNASQTVEVHLKCEVTFEVYCSGSPFEDALITCGDSSLFTNQNGIAIFNLENGIYDWVLSHPDILTIVGTVEVNGIAVFYSIIFTCSGITNSLPYNLKVYPNPSNGEFKIKLGLSNYSNGTITVFNLAGNTVYTSKMQEIKNSIIDLSSQPPGSYILKISNGEETFEKVIIIE